MSQKSENNNPILAFTDDELKEKEEELLRLIKKTIKEFKKSWLQKNEGKHQNSYYRYIKTPVKDHITFKKSAIYIKIVDDYSGIAVIWGRRKKFSGESWAPRNLKISFALNTNELLIKTDSYVLYPIENTSIIKDIFYRMNIQNNEDYNLLLKAFENLLITYI